MTIATAQMWRWGYHEKRAPAVIFLFFSETKSQLSARRPMFSECLKTGAAMSSIVNYLIESLRLRFEARNPDLRLTYEETGSAILLVAYDRNDETRFNFIKVYLDEIERLQGNDISSRVDVICEQLTRPIRDNQKPIPRPKANSTFRLDPTQLL